MSKKLQLSNQISGMIIESGSNANGTWVKYANGTMICHGNRNIGSTTTGGNKTGSLYYVDIFLPYTFPAVFVGDPPTCNITLHNENGRFAFPSFPSREDVTLTRFLGNMRILSAENVTLNLNYDIIAIGKWK